LLFLAAIHEKIKHRIAQWFEGRDLNARLAGANAIGRLAEQSKL
jgi:hypothetical protein